MSPRAARRLLWLVFVVALPLPFYLVETGRMPAAALLQTAAYVLAVIAREGTQGQIGLIAAILIGQGMFWVIMLWVAAWMATRLLARLPPRAIAAVTLSTVAVVLLLASSLEVYRTPFRARSLRATLLSVYE